MTRRQQILPLAGHYPTRVVRIPLRTYPFQDHGVLRNAAERDMGVRAGRQQSNQSILFMSKNRKFEKNKKINFSLKSSKINPLKLVKI